jgi:hypothetical protein
MMMIDDDERHDSLEWCLGIGFLIEHNWDFARVDDRAQTSGSSGEGQLY